MLPSRKVGIIDNTFLWQDDNMPPYQRLCKLHSDLLICPSEAYSNLEGTMSMVGARCDGRNVVPATQVLRKRERKNILHLPSPTGLM